MILYINVSVVCVSSFILECIVCRLVQEFVSTEASHSGGQLLELLADKLHLYQPPLFVELMTKCLTVEGFVEIPRLATLSTLKKSERIVVVGYSLQAGNC